MFRTIDCWVKDRERYPVLDTSRDPMSEPTNPYSSPVGANNVDQRTVVHDDRRAYISRLAVGGLIGGAIIGSFGYLLLTILFDAFLTPPLVSPSSYGQFFVVVLGVAIYSSCFGLALGLVPIVTWKGYVPINVLGIVAIVLFDSQFFANVNWLEAPISGMFIVFAMPSVAAIMADRWTRRNRGARQRCAAV